VDEKKGAGKIWSGGVERGDQPPEKWDKILNGGGDQDEILVVNGDVDNHAS